MFRKLVSACALSLVLAMLCPAAAAQPPSNVWRSSGPYGGAVAVMAASPMNSQTVYAGTHGGGLYRSIDGGLNWVSVQTSISDINALAIDPVNPQLMYAGDPAGHLYKTLNGWSTSSRLYLDQAHPEASFQLQGIAIDPLAPANLYVAAGLDGAFRSTDAGATWTPAIAWPGAYPGLTVSGISVVRLPGDARRVFAATNYGVFLSDDGAMTWTQANMPLGLFYAHTVVADPRTVPATFYAAAFDGVHTSTDSGSTWSAALAPAGAVSTNVFSIVVDPRAFSQGTVYAGVQNGGGVWTSMNGGANWQTFSDDLTAMDVQALAAVGGDANRFRLLAATFYIGGVFRRECACDPSFLSSWLESDTGMGAHINAVAVDPLNPQTIYATATSGVYRGIEDQAGNISWTRITSGLTGGWVTGLAVDPLTLGTIWAGVGRGNGGVFKSVDSGTNWTQVKPILPNSSGGWLRALALAPSSPGTVYAGTTRPGNSTGVFRSTDGGTNWTGPVGSASLTSPDVVALAVAPQSPNLVYAGTSFGGLFTSVDWGGTWTPANNGLTNSSVYALAIDPINANRMFAGTWGGGLFTSLDGASTWSPVAGVNLSWISAVAVAPSDAQSVYAAGGSVSRTTDGGATWRKLPDGLPGAGAVSLAVHPTSPATIYVGTNSGGVYASTFTDFAPPTTSAATSPALSGGWAKAAATVTLTAADESGGSGVKQIDYRLLGAQSGGATVVGTTATIEVTTEGPTTVEYWATDNAGNQESPHKTLQVGIDTRAPSASAQLMGPPPVVIGGQNWYTQNITVNVWGQDDFSQGSWSGVRQIWYSSSGAQIAPWTSVFGQNASVVVSADGTTSVSYYAEDYAGNVSPTATTVVNLDKTPPTTSATQQPLVNAFGWNTSGVTVTLNAVDNPGGTGVKQITYSLFGAQTQNQTGVPGNSVVVAISNQGSTTINYWATDQAGGQESIKSLAVTIDSVPPWTNWSQSPASNGITGNLNAQDSCQPNCSGVKQISYLLSGAQSQPLTTVPSTSFPVSFTITTVGTTTVTYYAQDNAGNVEAQKTQTVTYSGPQPPPQPPPFSYPVAPPQGACVCSPAILLNSPSHTWYVLADATGSMEISLFATGPDPRGAPTVPTTITGTVMDLQFHPIGTVGPVAFLPTPASQSAENSAKVTLTVAPGTTYIVRVDRSPNDSSPAAASQSQYRIETKGAVQAAMASPTMDFFNAVQVDDPDYMVRWGVNVAPGEALNLRIAGQASQTRIRLIRPDGTVRVKDATLITEGPPRNVSVLDAGSAPGQWRLEVLYANAPYRLNKLDGSDRGIYLTWVTGGGTTDGTFNVSVTDAGGTPASKPIKLTLTNNTTGEVYSGVSTGEVPLPEGFFFPLAGFSGQFPAGSYTVTASVPEGQTGYTVRPASVNVDLWCRKLVPLAFTIDYLTTTTVGSGPSPSVYGQGVTIAATVAGPPSAGIPQGTVTFLDGATTLGVVNLNGAGQAALTTWGLWAGVHQITAAYGGGGMFARSTGSAAQTVNPAPAIVWANPKTKTYGTANPVLDATVTGRVGADTLFYTLATIADQGSDVGAYPIVVTVTPAANPNYVIATADSTLTIVKATATLTIDPASLTYTYDGLPKEAAAATIPADLSIVSLAYSTGQTVAVAAGGSHTCALTSGGTVQCWGQIVYGNLTSFSGSYNTSPVMVNGLSDVVGLTAGQTHYCAVTKTGSVLCWGSNFYGQLGNPGPGGSSTPVAVSGVNGAVAVSAGINHTCAVTASGDVLCWGDNKYGQLGNGMTSQTPTTTPVVVIGLSRDVVAVAAGEFHTCALTAAGGAKCWGGGGAGQLGNGTVPQQQLTPVQVSGMSSGVVTIAAGRMHTCAVTQAGSVQCWGYNYDGQLGDGTTTSRSAPVPVSGLSGGVVALGAGDSHTCAVTGIGIVKCWGSNANGRLGDDTLTSRRTTPVDARGLSSGAVAVAAGYAHTCAVTGAGTAYCWGDNAAGQLGDGTMTSVPMPIGVSGLASGAAAAVAGAYHSCAVTTAGTVKCWGNNGYGQLGDGTTAAIRNAPAAVSALSSRVAAVTAGARHTCSLTSAGGVQCWGSGVLGDGSSVGTPRLPVGVSGLSGGVAAVRAGDLHTCALTSTGGVLCWGENSHGELGDGTTTRRTTPVQVNGLSSGVAAVTAGSSHTCAVTQAGAVLCWGYNYNGQLGDGTSGTTASRTTPVGVSGLPSPAVAVTAGADFTCALTTAGGVLCWGFNIDGRLGDGTTTSRSTPVPVLGLSTGVIAVSAGGNHACALMAQGTVQCWGSNRFGQLGRSSRNDRAPGAVSGLSGVAAVTAGFLHTCAVTAAGAVKCWGYNDYGSIGDGSRFLVPVAVPGLTSSTTTSPANAGTYDVRATLDNPNYAAEPAGAMLKILGAQGITQNVADEIETLSATVTDPNDKQQLDEALAQLSAALDPALWRSPLDQLQLDPTNGDKVFQAFADATKTLLKLIDDPTSTIPDAPLQALVDRIVAADRMLAVTAISAAGGGVTTMAATAAVSDATMAAAASPTHRVDKKIEEAMKELEKGDAEALAGKPRKAIDHYGKAWKKAQEAIKKS